jgi:hypothetical protein
MTDYNPAVPTQYSLTELFRLHRTPFLARHQDSRKLWQILGFGPNGHYIVGWVVGYENPELVKLSPRDREWVYLNSVGTER